MSEAAHQLEAVQAAGLKCAKCGSGRLHRSHTRGLREKLLKFANGVRAWRCDECGDRQLSDLRPRRRRSLPEMPASFRPNPGPDPKPAPSPEPTPDPLPLPDPNPRRTRRRDPLAEKLKARRMKRTAVTVALVVAAGLGAALIVMRTARHVTADVETVE